MGLVLKTRFSCFLRFFSLALSVGDSFYKYFGTRSGKKVCCNLVRREGLLKHFRASSNTLMLCLVEVNEYKRDVMKFEQC